MIYNTLPPNPAAFILFISLYTLPSVRLPDLTTVPFTSGFSAQLLPLLKMPFFQNKPSLYLTTQLKTTTPPRRFPPLVQAELGVQIVLLESPGLLSTNAFVTLRAKTMSCFPFHSWGPAHSEYATQCSPPTQCRCLQIRLTLPWSMVHGNYRGREADAPHSDVV